MLRSPWPPPGPVVKAASRPSSALDSPSAQGPLAVARGRGGVSRSPCARRGFGQGRSTVMTVAVSSFPLPETVLRTWLSVLPPGMPLTAAVSGLRGFSLPGVAILAARGRKGTHRALPGCGQELPRLKLETPTKGKAEETEGALAASCLPAAGKREPVPAGEGGRIPLRSPQRARPPTCTAGSVRVTGSWVRACSARAS